MGLRYPVSSPILSNHLLLTEIFRLSEILLLPLPNLPSLTSTSTTSIVTTGTTSFAAGEEIGGPGSLWLDEEDRDFYEELRELRGEVPSSILGLPAEKEVEKEVDSEAEKPAEEEIETEIETESPIEEAELELVDHMLP